MFVNMCVAYSDSSARISNVSRTQGISTLRFALALFVRGLPSKVANRNVDLVKIQSYIYFFFNESQRYDLLFFLGNRWHTKRKANRNVEVLNRNVEIPWVPDTFEIVTLKFFEFWAHPRS